MSDEVQGIEQVGTVGMDEPQGIEQLGSPSERGGSIKPFEYTEDSIPVQLSDGSPATIEVQGHVIEIETNPVSLSLPIEGDDLGAPLALLLQHHPDADTQKHVSFWEDEPWDQHTEMFMVTMSRAAWEAQGSPANVWVSMATISATTPEKEN